MAKRRPIAVIDAETNPFKFKEPIEPFIWGFFDGAEYFEFTELLDLIRFLYDKPLVVYAHNGGKFDFHLGIIDYIDPYSEIFIINGRIAKFKIGECEFRDSYNIVPVPMAQFEKTKIDYRLFEKDVRDLPENKRLISQYLKSDCINQYTLVSEFIERYGSHLTQASAAFNQWKKISKRDAPYDAFGELYSDFKKYYYGGRTQNFMTGVIKGKFCMWDINSAYPRAMLEKHPISLSYVTLDFCKLSDIPNDLQATAFFTVEAISKGALPFRHANNTYYPDNNVKRIYHITGHELLAALETDTLPYFKIIQAHVFDELIDFSDYILHFYEERKLAKERGDKVGDIFCKLFMNSLYGKFASNPDEYRNYMVVEPDIFDENGTFLEGDEDEDEAKMWSFSGEFGENALAASPLNVEEQYFYNIATSASITGYCRANLWKESRKCKGLLYFDTDSITAREQYGLAMGDDLGEWSLDGEFDGGGIVAPKTYAFKYQDGKEKLDKKTGEKLRWKTASKGVRLKPNAIMRAAKGKIVFYEQEAPTYSVHKAPTWLTREIKIVKRDLNAC